jgi:hypothetical protein
MTTWNTIHIFGFGTNQLISDSQNIQTPAIECPITPTVTDAIYALKPTGSNASADYHAINCFSGLFIDFLPNSGDSFRIQWENLDETFLADLSTLADQIVTPVTGSI